MTDERRAPLPTMSVRAAPEHQSFIREIARALRERPELETVLRHAIAAGAEAGEPTAPAADAPERALSFPTTTPPGHRVLLEATAATLRDIPESALSLGVWLSTEALQEPRQPAPGEYPKWVNGRLCADQREERRSLAQGPAPVPPPPPKSDWDRLAEQIDGTQSARHARLGHPPAAADKFFHGAS